jgi:FAD/FMN-containing dehydrogenase
MPARSRIRLPASPRPGTLRRAHRAAGTVTVGAGLRLIDFYQRLAAHGLAVPAGSCPTVGLAGLTLGGGVGVVGRAYGLTCDNLEALEIVTADGSVLIADATEHSDLYWASRGGGGGNFGVATSFTFRTHELSRLVPFFLSWPWSQAHRVIASWQHWAPAAPDALWSNLHLTAAPGGPTPSLQVGGTYLGSVAEATHHLDSLYAAVGAGPASTYLGESSYREAMLLEAGCSGLTVDQCQLPWQAPGGRLSREPSFAKSDFFTMPLSSAAITALLRGVEALRGVGGAPGGSGGVAFDSFGGALNRVPASATAFVHRDALFPAQYSTQWSPHAGGPGVARQHAWLREFYASMRPYASGQCYQNYIDPELRDWRTAYYGANYARLAQVKGAYDPRQVFSFPQAITPGRYPGDHVALVSGSGRARPARSA